MTTGPWCSADLFMTASTSHAGPTGALSLQLASHWIARPAAPDGEDRVAHSRGNPVGAGPAQAVMIREPSPGGSSAALVKMTSCQPLCGCGDRADMTCFICVYSSNE